MIEFDKIPPEIVGDLLNMWYGMPSVPRNAEVSYKNYKGNTTTRFKYATLDTILDIIRPYLASLKTWIVLTNVESIGDNVKVVPILLHKSGFVLKGDLIEIQLEEGASIQAKGSAITYARRYAIAAILGLCLDDDTDGDIKEAVIKKPAPVSDKKNTASLKPRTPMTPDQIKEMKRLKEILLECGIELDRETIEANVGCGIYQRNPSYEDAALFIDWLRSLLPEQ